MKLINKKTPWYKFVLVAPVVLSVFLTFSCQPDEETMVREAVAQSYEEVQAELKQVGEGLQMITHQYYPEGTGYYEVVKEKGSEIEALKAAGASGTDLQTFENLIAQRNQLHEKLMHLPDPDGVYTVVENQPEPSNGIQEFYQYIGQNLRYPSQARRMGIEGKVFVEFTVNEYGELTNFKTLKGIGAGCDEEAIQVLENAPQWNPGTTNGKPVKVKMVLPITFKLNSASSNSAEEPSSKAHENTSKLVSSDGKELSEMVVVGYHQKN